MHSACGGATNEERSTDASLTKSRSSSYHLGKRGSDKAAEANDIGATLECLLHDIFGRHHHAHIDDVVAITAHHHADDVLTNIMYIALDGSQEHLTQLRATHCQLAIILCQ